MEGGVVCVCLVGVNSLRINLFDLSENIIS